MTQLSSVISIGLAIALPAAAVSSAATMPRAPLRIEGRQIAVEFDEHLNSRIVSRLDGADRPLGEYRNSEFLHITGGDTLQFTLTHTSVDDWTDKAGTGKRYTLDARSDRLNKTVVITSYDDFPNMLLFQVTYANATDADIRVRGWTNNRYSFDADTRLLNKPPFWSYQPGSYGWTNDWLQPLAKGFQRDNYLGMNRVDYGGGTPVVDIWRSDVGLAVGHVEMAPKLVSLPVSMPTDTQATLAVTFKKSATLGPGDHMSTFTTFVAVHKGDHFQPLTQYSRFMTRRGIGFREAPPGAYETIWCGWGYEKDFTMEKFYGTFPMVKKLGIQWIVLDYGWHTGVGDYHLPKDKFPNGDADMRQVVRNIHAAGAKAKLWWMPLSVDPCTDLFRQHPEHLLLREDESPVFIEFWKSFFLCPASKEVRQLTRDFVVKAMRDWGWEGLKIDGNNLNTVPPCYNPRHGHARPEESTESLPDFFRMIYETALGLNPNAVVEICPCGTNQSFFILPYMNQSVSSDPSNSWQIRQKGKTLTALTQQKVVFYGDHVELSDGKSDFASTIGLGGVIGTKFVWPVGVHMNQETGDVSLTPEKERDWVKWIGIYKDKMLSKGVYRGDLYDIGYDRPETHAVQKGPAMYYAMFDPAYSGPVELRGLERRTYEVVDYENQKALGTVQGPRARLVVSFAKHLLIEVTPR